MLEPADDADEYTQPREETDIAILDEDERVAARRGRSRTSARSRSRTSSSPTSASRSSTNEVIEVVPLDFPPRELTTRACWYTVPLDAVDRRGHRRRARCIGAVHAAEHALIGLLPLFAICDRWDVGGVSMAMHPQTGEPTIFVYDGYPGGAGIAELAFDAARARTCAAARELVAVVPVRRRLPVVRAVAEVRQLERVPRQGRRAPPARALLTHPPRLSPRLAARPLTSAVAPNSEVAAGRGSRCVVGVG